VLLVTVLGALLGALFVCLLIPLAGWLGRLLRRYLASLLSIAAGSPVGLMHVSMSMGTLLVAPLRFLPPEAQAQLAAIGATALFAAANRTPLLSALFVFTLQGDPQLFMPLLLASAISAALADPLRGITWNEAQCRAARVPASSDPAQL
jgi:H+/Cl- antiporter ClcA